MSHYTIAALAVDCMELNGLSPARGKVLVNGASGGVASVAIEIDAGGAEFAGKVLPFILRGPLGVNVDNPFETKTRLWQRFAGDLKPPHLDRIARRIRFAELEKAFGGLLAARVTGRMVVDYALR